MSINISQLVLAKLRQKHCVTEDEVKQCFQNCEGNYLRDTREQHDTNPATHWFISETNRLRQLKVVFIAYKDPDTGTTRIDIKTAYPPNTEEIEIYKRHGGC